jgi:hypothetical protein
MACKDSPDPVRGSVAMVVVSAAAGQWRLAPEPMEQQANRSGC